MLPKKISVVLLILFFYQSVNIGQIFENEDELNKLKAKIDIHNFLITLLVYPLESIEQKEVGVSIAELKLMSDDMEDQIYILNSMSQRIDNQVINALKITAVNYRDKLLLVSEDSIITFYTIFEIQDNNYEIFYNKIPEKFIGPMRITARNNIRNPYTNQPVKTLEIKPDSHYLDKISESKNKIERLASTSKEVSSLKQNLIDKQINYHENKIIANLNELIRRNPFNSDLLLLRAELYKKHDQIVKAQKDLDFIQNKIAN